MVLQHGIGRLGLVEDIDSDPYHNAVRGELVEQQPRKFAVSDQHIIGPTHAESRQAKFSQRVT
jgi:hypothetical protein